MAGSRPGSEKGAGLSGTFPVRLLKAYMQSKAGNHAAGLAFNAFMTMFPLMLGILAIVGLVLRNAQIQAQVQALLVSAFPSNAQGTLSSTLQGVKQHSGLLGILSIAGLLWSGTGFFAFLEFALGELFGATQRGFIRQRLMGVVMVAIFTAAIILSVFANSIASSLPRVPYAGPVVGAAVMVGMMMIIYRVVPNRTFKLRDVWRGALVAGIGIEVITLAFPIYATLMHGFDTYGAAFALFFLLATWLYLVSQLILFGAVVNRFALGVPGEGGLAPAPPHESAETAGAAAIERQRRPQGPQTEE